MKEYEKRKFSIILELEEAPDYADVFTMDDFIEEVRHGGIMNYDGAGCLAIADENGKIWESNMFVDCSVTWLELQSESFTHVCWYNK